MKSPPLPTMVMLPVMTGKALPPSVALLAVEKSKSKFEGRRIVVGVPAALAASMAATSHSELFSVMLLFPGLASPATGPTEAVLLMEEPVAVFVCTTRVKVADAPGASEEIHADTAPSALPAAGALVVQLVGPVQETSVE